MSKEDLVKVLGEAVVDRDFLNRLVNDHPKNVRTVAKELTPNLDEKELIFLEEMDYKKVQTFAEQLDIQYIKVDDRTVEKQYNIKGHDPRVEKRK
jgi:hypothetical protein